MKSLHLAGADDLERLLPMVVSLQAERQQQPDEALITAALTPLLEGAPQGAAWLIGPRKAPVGYVVVSFGWSLESGGMTGTIDQIYIRPAVRSRGMGSEALFQLTQALRQGGVTALQMEVAQDDEHLKRFCRRARLQDRHATLMRCPL
ncbi:GNAT family N-acetyltransferase [Salipiger mangrovisoli]|uniref:GNAT family N-acetyltransferase n=1 Tax=Salipiger mangrovisoli TaxID=2865933 RepID=A0ABR9X3R0_9RHOB|nr:GNAT family N-acetyltransferase [Salipiger mangrovisoli]MBE9638088.1 GNAT family N-acetyltransferase [Salipiger mangrovisoli]